MPGKGSVLRPALLLTAGRTLAFGAGFFIPVVLARVFTVEEFGTYKQIFLLYTAVYLAAQMGLANSLFYFLPRAPERAARYITNSTLALAGVGTLIAVVVATQSQAVEWLLSNPRVEPYLAPLGAYLVLMMVATPLEIVMISRSRYRHAAATYAVSDMVRAALFILPAAVTGRIEWLMAGAVAFALGRCLVMAGYFRREFRRGLRPSRELLREQVSYSVPFGLAVLVGTLQSYYHQFFVSHAFDPATFAIYAVGCLQIPIVDFVATPTGDVMMVRMAEELRDGHPAAARATWHDAMGSLALMFFPLVGVLIAGSRELIVLLYTSSYLDSVPIFRLWTLTILLVPLFTEGVLRVFAATRMLLVLNLIQLGIIVALIGPFLSVFGLPGAVLITVTGTAVARLLGLVRIRGLLDGSVRRLLPWRRLTLIGLAAGLAFAGAVGVREVSDLSDLPRLLLTGSVYALIYAVLVRWWKLAPDDAVPDVRGWLRRLAPAPAHSESEAR